MVNGILWIIFSCLSCCAQAHMTEDIHHEGCLCSISSESDQGSKANTECEPTAIVDGNVCVITGDFIESITDLMIPGIEPLDLHRSYSSSAPDTTNLHYGWNLNHHGYLMKAFEFCKLHAFFCHPSGLTMHYSQPVFNPLVINELKFDKEGLKNGVTNCANYEISGRTNCKNTRITVKNTSKFRAVDGGGTKFYFGSQTIPSSYAYVHPLLRIKKPNGMQITYNYNHAKLDSIKIGPPRCAPFQAVAFTYPNDFTTVASTSDGRQVCYRMINTKEGSTLFKVTSNCGIPQTYTYSLKNKHNPARIIRRKEPLGRCLEVEYYEVGTPLGAASEDIIDSHHDPRIGRVKILKKPVGTTAQPIATRRFEYDIKEKGCKVHKTLLGGSTKVFDAYGHQVCYHYSDEHRLTAFEKYKGEEEYSLHSVEKFYWGPSGSINDSLLISKTMEEPTGRVLSCRHFTYDDQGNILRESWWGNLSGNNTNSLILNSEGIPQPNENEYYQKRYRYTSDGLNLKTYEGDLQHALVYEYEEGTDRLVKKFMKSKGAIRIRHFYEYDAHGALAKEIVDDGCCEELENLSEVSERRIKISKNRTERPIGLPEEVFEGYQDLSSGEFVMLRKFTNEYDAQGHLIRQAHYDSTHHLCYVLQWEYDKQGHVIQHINALGQVIEKKYDLYGNKIFEQGPSCDFYTLYHYDYANRLVKTEKISADGSSYVQTYAYDYLGNKIASVDYYGNETRYHYDEFGRVIQTLYPAVASTDGTLQHPCEKSQYDIFGNLTSFEDAEGRRTNKTYNLRGQPVDILYPDGKTEKCTYDLNGNLIKSISKNGAYALYTYDYQSRLIKTEYYSPQDELLSTSKAVYNAFHLIEETDAEGIKTQYKYDDAGRLSMTKKGSQKHTYHYDNLGRLAATREYFGYASHEYIVKANSYDLLNRVIEERIEDAEGKIESFIQYVYDSAGRKIETIRCTTAGLSTQKIDYDILGNVIQETDALGHVTRHVYRYDHINFHGQNTPCTETTDPLGRICIVIKDALGRIESQILKNPLGQAIHYTKMKYTLGGHVISQTDVVTSSLGPSRETEVLWEYDSCGRRTSQIEAAYTPEQKVTRYAYNDVGLQDRIFKPDGTLISTVFDFQNRPVEIYSSDGTIHYVYHYDSKGRMVNILDRIHQRLTQKEYDDNDLLISETLAHGYTILYKYDRLGRILSKELPDGSKITYRYRGNNLQEIHRKNTQGENIYHHTYLDYDLSGRVLNQEMIVDGKFISHRYDLLGRCIEINSPYWQEKISEFDAYGNILARTFTDGLGEATCQYIYDTQNQLLYESGESHNTYSYDSHFNRLSKNAKVNTFNPLNQLLSDSSGNYTYDLNGRLISKTHHEGILQFEYDALDRLTATIQNHQKTLYFYDAFNRRLQKKVVATDEDSSVEISTSDAFYLYEGLDEMGCLDDKGQLKALKILGQGICSQSPTAIAIEIDNNLYAPLHDINGNIRALVNAQSHLIEETYRFSAFGEESLFNAEMQCVRDSINPWRFSGKRVDPETGFVYFGHRYYDPIVGRWITPDPLGMDEGPNLYAYVSNNPIGHIDAYGLFEETPWEGCQNQQSEPRSFIDKALHTLGRAIEAIGDYLMPIPYVRDAVSYIGHCLAGGSRESFSQKGFGGKSHYFDLGRQELNPQANIIFVNGILNSKSNAKKNAEQISQAQNFNNVHVVYNSSHGLIFDVLESLAQKIGFETHSVKMLVKTIKERINALGGTTGGGKLLVEGHSQGGLIVNCALKHLSREEKEMMHIITFGSAHIVSDNVVASADNFVSSRDIIPYVANPTAHIRRLFNKKEPIKYLKSSYLPFIDHPLRNDTYKQALSTHAYKSF